MADDKTTSSGGTTVTRKKTTSSTSRKKTTTASAAKKADNHASRVEKRVKALEDRVQNIAETLGQKLGVSIEEHGK